MASAGELFINLGIKGADKTIGAISSTKKGMGELASTSIEAKAAILGALYGLERLMAHSGQLGTSLVNASTTLDMQKKTLQQYQYAARQAGASNEEMIGSFKSLQTAMAQVDLNKGMPEYLKLITTRLAAVGESVNIADKDNIPKMMQYFSHYAQLKGVSAREKQLALGQFFSPEIIAGMMRGNFNPAELVKAPTLSDATLEQNNKINIAWSNLHNKIEQATAKFNARHGKQLIDDIDKVTTSVLKLVGAFTTLAEKLQVFTKLGKAFEGWTMFFDAANEGVAATNDLAAGGKKAEARIAQIKDVAKYAPSTVIALFKDKDVQSLAVPGFAPVIAAIHAAIGNAGNTTVIQNIDHHGDAKDTKAVGSVHKTAAKAAHEHNQRQHNKAVRTNAAGNQGN